MCLALGIPHPDYLLGLLTARQLADWEAYYGVEPFGDERADLRAGIVACTIANIHLKKGKDPLSALDFMPFAEKPRNVAAERLRKFFQSKAKGT